MTSRCQIYSPRTSRTVVCLETGAQVDEFLSALEVKVADRIVEVDESGGNDGQGNDGEVVFGTGVLDAGNFLLGDGQCLGKDIDHVEPDPGDVLESGLCIHPGLTEGAVDNS